MLKKVDVSAIWGEYDPFFLNTHLLSQHLSFFERREEGKTIKLLAECLLRIAITHYANKPQRI